MLDKDAFLINHHDSVLAGGTLQAGTNLLVTNSNFENGVATGWTVTALVDLTWGVFQGFTNPSPPDGQKVAGLMNTGATNSGTATLESDRVAVTAGSIYIISLAYRVFYNDTLNITVKWWDAASGGNLKGTSEFFTATDTSNRSDPTLWLFKYATRAVKAATGATHASVFISGSASNLPGGSVPGMQVDTVFLGLAVNVPPPLIEPLYHKSKRLYQCFDNLTYSTNAREGFKNAAFRLYGEPEWLVWWLNNCLGHHITTHYEGQTAFEGLVWTMEGLVGGVPRRVSYDTLANYVIVRYLNGEKALAASDSASQIRYGFRQKIFDEPHIYRTPDAQNRANVLVSEYKNPQPSVYFTGDDTSAEDYLDVTVMGYYSTIGFFDEAQIYFNYGADTSAIIATATAPRSILYLLRSYGNVFISDDYGGVNTTGTLLLTGGDTEAFSQTNPLELTNDLLKMGDSNNRILVSGVWDNRKFVIRARPTTIGYIFERDDDGKGLYRRSGDYGARIPKPLVRAGDFLRLQPHIPRFTTYTDAALDPSAQFLWEVNYNAEDDKLSLITPDTETLEAGLSQAVAWSNR